MCLCLELIWSIIWSLCCCECLKKTEKSSSKRKKREPTKSTNRGHNARESSKTLDRKAKPTPVSEISDEEFRRQYVQVLPKDSDPEDFLRSKNYEILMTKPIGRGGYGVVYQAIKHEGDIEKRIAVKVMNVFGQRARKTLRGIKREIYSIGIIKKYPTYKHDHIVHVYDAFLIEYNDTMRNDVLIRAYIFMDLADGNMADELAHTGPMSDEMAKKYFVQMVYALDYLHTIKMAHRDIKLENFLVYNTGTDKKTVKLTDFGLADIHFTEERGFILTPATGGSSYYKAPEILRNELGFKEGINYYKVDMWALGVCLFRMFTDRFPFEGFPNIRKVLELQQNKRYTLRTPNAISPKARDLVGRLLEPKAVIRPFMSQGVKNNKWLEGEVSLTITTV